MNYRAFLDSPPSQNLAAVCASFEGAEGVLTISDGAHTTTLDFFCGSPEEAKNALLKIDALIQASGQMRKAITDTMPDIRALSISNTR